MTTENDLDVIKTVDNKEELNNETSLKIEEPIELTSTNTNEELTIATEEEEQINVEKPKRAGRKKRMVSSISDVKIDNLNNDNVMDTQPLFEQPIIVEGKRSRKPTSRLELTDSSTPKKELSIPQGHGKPLGDIEYINYQLTHASTDALSRMHSLCFGRRSGKANIRQTLRDFKGFEFELDDEEEYQRHLGNLTKLKKDQLRSLSDILGLPATGRNPEHAERILKFLMEPVDEGKQIPERKMSMRTSKKSSTNSKESINTDEEEEQEPYEDEEEKVENNDDIFGDEDEDEATESDDNYIGSDEESGLITKDDPDDFVYQPGKKTPKKKSPIKRSRSRTTNKRKRVKGASTPSKRGRKKTKVTIDEKKENEDATVSDEPMQINNEETEKTNEDNSTTTINDVVPANNNLNNTDIKLTEQNDATTTNTAPDIIPATS